MRSHRHSRPRPTHEQNQWQQKQEDDSQQSEHVDERDHRRLLLDHARHGSIRAPGGRCGVGARREITLPCGLDGVLRRRRVLIDMGTEDVEVLLLLTREQRTGERGQNNGSKTPSRTLNDRSISPDIRGTEPLAP